MGGPCSSKADRMMIISTWAKEDLKTGKRPYTDGSVTVTDQHTRDTAADPVVSESYQTFPMRHSCDGYGRIIFLPQWAEQKLAPRGTDPEPVQ